MYEYAHKQAVEVLLVRERRHSRVAVKCVWVVVDAVWKLGLGRCLVYKFGLRAPKINKTVPPVLFCFLGRLLVCSC